MADLAKNERTAVKGSLTRFMNYFNSVKDADDCNLDELHSRLLRCEFLFDKFNTAQLTIEANDIRCDENYDTIHIPEREAFEAKFFKITSQVKKFLFEHTSPPPSTNINNCHTQSHTGINNVALGNIKLPPIILPTFDGKFDQWLFFRDSFTSLIHDNNVLSNVQKFHYLRLSLQGIAAETLRSLEISDANYNVAWNLLQERFENKQLLVNNHIKSLFNLPMLTKESYSGLRLLLDGMQTHINALEALKMPTTHWDVLIIYLISSKFDGVTRRAWETENNSSSGLPTLQQFIDFLKNRCRILDALDQGNNSTNKPVLPPKPKDNQKSFAFVSNQNKCYFCKGEHLIYSCPDFLQKSAIERLNSAKRLQLCVNCLCAGHPTKECRSSGCRKCGQIHHTLLHFQKYEQTFNNQNNTNNNSLQLEQNTSHMSQVENSYDDNHVLQEQSVTLTTNTVNSRSQVLLSTAVVNVLDRFGQPHSCRVLLDNGSQSNFMSQRLCNLLQLSKEKIRLSVTGINQITENIPYRVVTTIQSTITQFERKLSCLILTNITSNIPSLSFDPTILNIPKNISLADPHFNQSGPIDLLIGADTFWDLLCIGQIKLGINLPVMQKTKLGWIISGPILSNNQHISQNSTHCHFTKTSELENKLTKFWELETYKQTKFLSGEELSCEEHFKQNLQRNDDGRFVVAIPLNDAITELGESRTNATKRFLNLERKLDKDSNLKTEYSNFIQEYLDLNHMSLAANQDDNTGFFLPHHAVIKESSTTTKTRVVFDGSAKSTSGLALNDCMMVGPNIQDDLFSILLRFRQHPIVLSADIEKMYRQVLVQNPQRSLQKILWRFNSVNDISVFELNTVTYGTASASFLAIRALQEIGHIYSSKNPIISSIILHDFYVDDLLTGGQTIDEVNLIKTEISSILKQFGFPLRKWRSNEKSIEHDNDDNILSIGQSEPNKTLGLLWNSSFDTLEYTIMKPNFPTKITKRQILSSIAQVFDPLGLLSPVIITAKVILQQLWKLKIGWDESIPMDLHTTWAVYRTQLTNLNNIKIPRHVLGTNSILIQAHGFSDASETGYGACIYIRCTDAFGNCCSNLLCSKTRVAPLKHTTIPRLELCAALLLAELMEKIKNSMNLTFESIFYWSDSTIVLSWIRTSPHLLKVFVANRVSQINNLTDPNVWRYINTTDNPADCLTRGMLPLRLINCELWFHGPNWLTSTPKEWPNHTFNLEQELVETRDITQTLHSTESTENKTFELFTKYSSLSKLVRVFALMQRFKNNSLIKSANRHLRQVGTLSPQELDYSVLKLTKIAQLESFPEDYKSLIKNSSVSSKSKLLQLNPFMDNITNIIRVGGRILNSKYDFDKKHPVVLPPRHPLTLLIARDQHIRLLHAGPQALLASLREKYWPLSGRNLARKIVHDCTTCFRFNAKPEQYIMGNLPASRITPARPFLTTGLDYAGPFLLRDRKGRNFKTSKAYVSLFICFVTKAIHLEVVSDLTTECFLAALKRFMARRGKCSQIFSDNGTNFVGANNELQSFLNNHSFDIETDLANEGINWNFIPPRAPHFGGLWEAGVKSVKYHLKRVVGNASLTYEDFCTVLYQIEACLNSRPLCPLSDDPNDPTSLTPAHFIIGDSLTTTPDANYQEINENRLSRFQRLQQIVQHFWSRWSKEYVTNLQIRTKWKQNFQQNLQVGVLVLSKDDGLPPLKWTLGRVTELYYGPDGIVRTVSIRTATGIFKRPVVKICVFPKQSDLY